MSPNPSGEPPRLQGNEGAWVRVRPRAIDESGEDADDEGIGEELDEHAAPKVWRGMARYGEQRDGG